jgi:hypothetical protein
MIVTHKITIDLARRGVKPVIDAVQNDTGTRNVELSLFANGVPWEIPADTSFLVKYERQDGTGGSYDTLPDGNKAYFTLGNMVTFVLVSPALSKPGQIDVQLQMDVGDGVLSTFSFLINAEKEVTASGTTTDEDYTNIQAIIKKEVEDALDDAKTVRYTPQTLTTEQQAQARKNIGVTSSGGGVTSWNDLTDKPFDDETVYYEWNRNTEYTEKAPLYDGTEVAGYMVKLSDDVPSPDFFIGKYAKIAAGSETEQVLITEDFLEVSENLYTVAKILIVALDAEEIESGGMSGTLTKGVWCPDLSDSLIESLKIIDPAKPIPEAMIPDTIARVSQIPEIPEIPEVPVQSVNGQTGEVEIDVGVTSINGRNGETWTDRPSQSWWYLWDKPFDSGKKVIRYSWDDQYQNAVIRDPSTNFLYNDTSVHLRWVHSYAPSVSEVVGGDIWVERDDGTGSDYIDITEDMIEPLNYEQDCMYDDMGYDTKGYRINCSQYSAFIYVIREHSLNLNESPCFQRSGTYFSYMGPTGARTYVRRLRWEYEKKLDEKYIPDTIARVRDIPEGGGGLSRDEVQTMINEALGVIENGTY